MLQIFFVGGLGQHEGRDLSCMEAMAIAMCIHRLAESGIEGKIQLHTHHDSWRGIEWEKLSVYANNAGIILQRIMHFPEDYSILANGTKLEQGAHMSDFLRLKLLSRNDNAIYMDTDCYVLERSFFSDMVAFGQGRKLIAIKQTDAGTRLQNGMIYVPHRQHPIIVQMLTLYANAQPDAFAKWDDLSCKAFGKVASMHPNLLLAISPKYANVPMKGEPNQRKLLPMYTGAKLLQTYIHKRFKQNAFKPGGTMYQFLQEQSLLISYEHPDLMQNKRNERKSK